MAKEKTGKKFHFTTIIIPLMGNNDFLIHDQATTKNQIDIIDGGRQRERSTRRLHDQLSESVS